MTDSPTQPSGDAGSPIICTLTPSDRSERELEWSDVGALASSTERIDGGIRSSFPAELESRIRDLAARETSCCGTWLRTSVVGPGGDGSLTLELTTDHPEGLATILAMAGLDG